MSIELRVHSGALTGRTFRFDQPTVVIGRQPTCDIAFDPVEDRDVSGKHAEIRLDGDRAFVRDAGSTNGTWVNGVRISGEQELVDGDFVSFGADGPRLAVGLATPARVSTGSAGAPPPTRVSSSSPSPVAGGPPRRDTTMRIAEAVKQSTRGLQRTLIGVTVVLGLGAIGAYLYGKTQSDAVMARMAAQNDSLSKQYTDAIARMNGRSSGLDSALRAAKKEIDVLSGKLRAGSGSVDVEEMKRRIADANSRAAALVGQANMDLVAINERSGRAVALLVVENADGTKSAATGFTVNDKGLLVTNRHAVREGGQPPTRIAVKFAETDKWLRAHVVRVSEGDDDIAVLQIDAAGPFPFVAGVGTAADMPRVGQPVAIIGYPLGLDIATEGGTLKGAAHASLNPGTVSKSIDARTQIDGYAAQGSSGSPVFDSRGFVVGVVYGGPTEAQGRIVYAVPVGRLAAELAK